MADFIGTAGNDTIGGTTLQDTVMAAAGNDAVEAGSGDDLVQGGAGNDIVFGEDGNDSLYGGSGDDMLSDGDGSDLVEGGAGNDFVVAGRGNDVLIGGSGFDTIDYSATLDAIKVDLGKGTLSGVSSGSDIVQGFEKIVGTSFADTFRGSSGAEVIHAGGGDDVIRSLGGADVLDGGAGDDIFVFRSQDVRDAAGNHLGFDTIVGFTGDDTLDVSAMLKGMSFSQIADVVRFASTDTGAMLQVRQGDAFVDVALLEGVNLATATSWASDGSLLV